MKPGRTLDELIAEKVFGRLVGESYVINYPDKTATDYHYGPLEKSKPYSTNPDAAQEVLEKLSSKFGRYGIGHESNRVTIHRLNEGTLTPSDILGTGETFEHAVCLAALEFSK